MKQNFTLPTVAKMIKSLWPYLWSHPKALKTRVVLSFLFLLLSMAVNIYTPLLLRNVIDVLSQNIIAQITMTLLAYSILWTIGQIILPLREMVMFKSIQRSIRLFCIDFLEHLHKLPFQFHVRQPLGEITNTFERAQQAFPNFIWGFVFLIIPTLIETVCAIMIIWQLYNWLYSLIIFLTLLCFSTFSIVSMKRSLKAEVASNIKELQASTMLVDSLVNQATVKYFNNFAYEIEKCNNAFQEREIYTTKTLFTLEGIKLIQGIILGIGLTVLLFIAGQEVIIKNLEISDFVLLNGYILQFAYPLTLFGFVLKESQQSFIDLSNIIKIMDHPLKKDEQQTKKILQMPFRNISFENVFFGYDEALPTLKNISFVIPEGHITAVVGTSGAGKSTLSALLLNFYEVTQGSIKIGDININDIQKQALNELIGIVPQEISLFHDSILENVRYARLNASMEEIKEALLLACLDTETFTDGIHTLVGERGAKLSQGEKQRIALARLFLQKPKVCILDEHTSSLDTNTEQRIQKNIKKFFKGSTFFIIAHKLKTIMSADQIIVLEKGKIIAIGTHKQLIKSNNIYASLWQEQLNDFSSPEANSTSIENKVYHV